MLKSVDDILNNTRITAGKSKKRKKMNNDVYESELARLEIELAKLHEWIKLKELKVVVVFEGRNVAGKAGTIKRIAQCFAPKACRVVALPKPTEKEQKQGHFQRYVQHLPSAGEMVIFDRSWYKQTDAEQEIGFGDGEEHLEFLRACPEFERMLVSSGIILLKYWFSVAADENEKDFQGRIGGSAKFWELSPMDIPSHSRGGAYSKAKDEIFVHCDIQEARWHVIEGDEKRRSRLNVMRHLLTMINYQDLSFELETLPLRQFLSYIPSYNSRQNYIAEKYCRI